MVADLPEEERRCVVRHCLSVVFPLSFYLRLSILDSAFPCGAAATTRAFWEFEAAEHAVEVDAALELPWEERSLAHRVTMPKSANPTYLYATKTAYNEAQLGEWHNVTRVDLLGVKAKWASIGAKAPATGEWDIR
eukprot:SAG22_NODE_7556_length_729_cov_0.704762_1_plen_135_part_10